MTQSTEDMVSVRDAAEASGYTKTHIHELAKGEVIRSRMVTDNFRLVSQSDLMAYKKNGKTAIAKEEVDALEQVTAQRDAALAACEKLVEVWDRTGQFIKTDVAVRMARIAIEKAAANEI